MSTQPPTGNLRPRILRREGGAAVPLPEGEPAPFTPETRARLARIIGDGMRLLLAAVAVRDGLTQGIGGPSAAYTVTTSPDGAVLHEVEVVVTLPDEPLRARFDRRIWPDGDPLWYIENWLDSTPEQRARVLSAQVNYPDPVID